MPKITVTLTEDQAWLILGCLEETVLDNDGFADEYKPEEIAFGKRVHNKICTELEKLAEAKS